MTVTPIAYPSVDERKARGKNARDLTPVASHTDWRPATDRPDPIALLQQQNLTREPDLVPVRHGRMMVSPFTFYRGAAKIMAADLDGTPTAGLVVQLCGDAHLSNFGVFASPERRLLFDLNDFDETLPGPFEYDVKRMAASFTIAGRNNGFSKADERAATLMSVQAYREAMAEFAEMRMLEVWYAHLAEDDLMRGIQATVTGIENQAKIKKRGAGKPQTKANKDAKAARRAAKNAEKARMKAHTRDSLQALSKLGELANGRYRIVSQPPIVIPARDLASAYGMSSEQVDVTVRDQLQAYLKTLPDDRRQLLVSRAGSWFTVCFRDDGVGVFGPDKGLAAFVPAVDERRNRLDQVGDRVEGAAADGLAGDDPEEDLDHVQPGPAGWGEVQGDPRVAGQPGLHRRMLVRGVVVTYHVQPHPRVGLGDLLEEAQELLVAVARLAQLLDAAGGHLEGGEQGGGAMADVVMGGLLRQSEANREDRRGPVQRLDLALLIDADHDGLLGRIHIQAHDVADLGVQCGVGGELERLSPPRLQVPLAPDPGHRGEGDLQLRGQQPGRPVRHPEVRGRAPVLGEGRDHDVDLVDLRRPPAARLIFQGPYPPAT